MAVALPADPGASSSQTLAVPVPRPMRLPSLVRTPCAWGRRTVRRSLASLTLLWPLGLGPGCWRAPARVGRRVCRGGGGGARSHCSGRAADADRPGLVWVVLLPRAAGRAGASRGRARHRRRVQAQVRGAVRAPQPQVGQMDSAHLLPLLLWPWLVRCSPHACAPPAHPSALTQKAAAGPACKPMWGTSQRRVRRWSTASWAWASCPAPRSCIWCVQLYCGALPKCTTAHGACP
jgi:hypothetical protein